MIARIKFESGVIVSVEGQNSASQEIVRFVDQWNSPEKSVVSKTSGSTGIPKDILLEKSEMVASAELTGIHFSVNRSLRAWHALPMSFIAGKMMVVRALLFNWELLVSEPTSVPQLPEDRPDFSALTPMQFSQLIENGMDIDFSNQTILGGGEVSVSLLKKIENARSKIYSTYGMTETITHIASCLLTGLGDIIYTSLPGVTFSADPRGCLVIKANHLSASPIITNDMVTLISQTQFKFSGRIDRVINSGGLKIHPEDIEKKLKENFDIELFVDGVEDELLGIKAVLFIEEKNSDKMEDIKKFMEENMERKKAPREIIVVDAFKFTHTGKLIKKS